MHADTEQLLALIDGDLIDANLRKHALACVECQMQIEQLQRTRARLRELPFVAVPPVSTRILKASAPAVGRRWPVVALASAAAIALVFVLSTRGTRAPQINPAPAALSQNIAKDPLTQTDLARRSAELEREWRTLRARSGAVQRVGYVAGTSRIKSRLQQLDASYTDAAGPRYWDQRVALLDSLVTLERAEILARPRSDYRVVRTRNSSNFSGDHK